MNALNAQGYAFQKNQGSLIESILESLRYMCHSKAGLAIGSVSKAKVLIANTVTYSHANKLLSKTTAEVAFTATTHDIPANADAEQEACYLLSLSANGTPTLTMGTIASGAGNAKLPERVSGLTPIGYVRVVVDAGSTKFDASTDELDASHLTVTYVDLGHIHPMVDEEL